MDGKDTMLIGETTPFAMTVSELMLTDILQPMGRTIGKPEEAEKAAPKSKKDEQH